MDNKIFSTRLKKLRENMSMTQKEFSEFISIRQQTLSGYETGRISPSLEIAVSIAQKTNTSINWLCGLSETKSFSGPDYSFYSEIIDNLSKISQHTYIDVFENVTQGGDIYNAVIFKDRVMQYFIEDWAGILELRRKKTIDEKLYNLWIEDKKKEYFFTNKTENDMVYIDAERQLFLDEKEGLQQN